jgi:hypothetical protein
MSKGLFDDAFGVVKASVKASTAVGKVLVDAQAAEVRSRSRRAQLERFKTMRARVSAVTGSTLLEGELSAQASSLQRRLDQPRLAREVAAEEEAFLLAEVTALETGLLARKEASLTEVLELARELTTALDATGAGAGAPELEAAGRCSAHAWTWWRGAWDLSGELKQGQQELAQAHNQMWAAARALVLEAPYRKGLLCGVLEAGHGAAVAEVLLVPGSAEVLVRWDAGARPAPVLHELPGSLGAVVEWVARVLEVAPCVLLVPAALLALSTPVLEALDVTSVSAEVLETAVQLLKEGSRSASLAEVLEVAQALAE